MNTGDTLQVQDPDGAWYDATSLWSGEAGRYLCAWGHSWNSSLKQAGSQQPAKGVSGRGRPAPIGTSQRSLS